MTVELRLLVWSVALVFAQLLLTVTGAILQVGVSLLCGNRDKVVEYSGWVVAQRFSFSRDLAYACVYLIGIPRFGMGSFACWTFQLL